MPMRLLRGICNQIWHCSPRLKHDEYLPMQIGRQGHSVYWSCFVCCSSWRFQNQWIILCLPIVLPRRLQYYPMLKMLHCWESADLSTSSRRIAVLPSQVEFRIKLQSLWSSETGVHFANLPLQCSSCRVWSIRCHLFCDNVWGSSMGCILTNRLCTMLLSSSSTNRLTWMSWMEPPLLRSLVSM